jgi:tetratricopeptide (TPR) repeat protein
MKLKHTRALILVFVTLLVVGGAASYVILLHPSGIFVRWAQAVFPKRITEISFGPYPTRQDLRRFKAAGGKYVVSLLDPRLPYEKALIARERGEAERDGLIFKDFPMASVFDHRIFDDYRQEEEKAVGFLKNADGPAYVHCYLGKHRVMHVRDALARAGVPARLWTPVGSDTQYWDLVTRLDRAEKEFEQDNFAKVLETLQPVTLADVDVSALRGWSYYRLGLYDEASAVFSQGLKLDPANPRNLVGLGYCYLQQGQPVMAQRKFERVLGQIPEQEGALVGEGLAYLALQQKPQAAQVFRKVLSMDPKNAEVENYLRRAESE